MRGFGANQKQQHIVVIINAATVRKTEALIQACEHCNEEDAQFPFAVILDCVTDSDPSVTTADPTALASPQVYETVH